MMQYVEILPLVKTGGGDQVFTYETEEEVRVGSLVSIPLRNRLVKGMVTAIVSKPTFVTRPLKKVLSLEPVLTEIQLNLAKKIAEYYLCDLSDVIPTMLPFEFGKKRRVTNSKQPIINKLEEPLKLTEEQTKVFKTIKAAEARSKHLLFGVTGSGKTEIYLQLIAESLNNGQGAIVLVPEISLTPQTVKRFKNRFGEQVAVWHSEMKETEKYHTWEQIKSGEKRVVVGARSAIFTPVLNLGYIFIDEEHEGSYKQDQTPRYEAGQVAEWLCELTGAKLVLGSATPKVESYQKTETGKYNLCLLNKRIAQEMMPPVKIIDLRDEFKKGNKSIFSEELEKAIEKALAQKKQVVLFVNRRGASTFIVCRDCGYVETCPHCEVPLTYHPSEGQVAKCHHCGYKKSVPTTCPVCGSFAIKFFGLGTQRAELEAKKRFPNAKVVRMDRDTTQKRGSHEEIYEGFAQGDFDILIGTQLVAKGWDLPNVAVVGVISADTSLNLPDFRSAERTFSLLTQVAGRTGRGYHPGEVVVQTYAPENYAIKTASKHDFLSFYEKEINDRKKYNYPPFTKLIKLTYSAASSEKAQKETVELAEVLSGNDKIQIIGPSPAFISKLAGRYRWQLVLKASKTLQNDYLEKIKTKAKEGWTVDVNPESLL